MPAPLVGSKIRTRREALGLKQRDVAARSGISASYLNLIEHNRRGIAGKVLIAIAKVLEVEVSALQEGGDSDVLRRVEAAAARDPDAQAEISRTQEFMGRFPGWARVLAGLEQRAAGLERRIGDLSDRLAHDPFLADSLHEVLSSVTAIHATSGILEQADDMEPLQRHRFQANIHEESARLSHLSRALVNHFAPDAATTRAPATPLDEVEGFFAANGYHFPALDQGAECGVTPKNTAAQVLAMPSAETLSQDALRIAAPLLAELARDSRALARGPFGAAARDMAFDPLALARHFEVSPAQAMRRLAFLPDEAHASQIGLISCDAAGAVLLRKPVAGFPLPRYGSACALWPLYQAMTRPHLPLKTLLLTPDERLFESYAYCEYMDNTATVPVLRATMMLREIHARGAEEIAPVPVGQSCRICDMSGCPARREPSIHGHRS